MSELFVHNSCNEIKNINFLVKKPKNYININKMFFKSNIRKY